VSVQFGRWNFDRRPADREYLAEAERMVAPYGPDGGDIYIKDSVAILYRAFHATNESRKEIQPLVTPSGAVLTWDGRLDNRPELIRELKNTHDAQSTDVSIVAAAYERWGAGCFARLIGDWALSIWNPWDQSLTLAKDPIGTRHLYYAFDQEQVSWSTILDPLVLLAGETFALEEEYIAGWLSFSPATHLTPYVGIHSVPPCSSVLIRAGKHTIGKYWDFDASKRIRYRTDAEYEEHFRTVFGESVARRLRSDSPILAELSGGMDSSSIVCMADTIIGRGVAETPRLDTISYYDDSEPNWNERPYFTMVDEKRGRRGCHIDFSPRQSRFKFDDNSFAATPGSLALATGARAQFAACIVSQGNRVLLSGTGGDEVMGGVPTPTAELADLLSRARLRKLVSQMVAWALAKRKPLLHLLADTVRVFLPAALARVEKHREPPVWIQSDFAKRNRSALRGYQERLKVFGPLPTFQENLCTLDALRRQLACSTLSSRPPYRECYPYLDRDLLEFLFAVPREQLVRPHQRRSLMRRALAGIVPGEILNRRRKAYAARGPIAAVAAELPALVEISQSMASSAAGIVDPGAFLEEVRRAHNGLQIRLVPLTRTVVLESWMRQINRSHLRVTVSRGCEQCPRDEVPETSVNASGVGR
jgi:asparagine synthase (glutamine-hydrolysing)